MQNYPNFAKFLELRGISKTTISQNYVQFRLNFAKLQPNFAKFLIIIFAKLHVI